MNNQQVATASMLMLGCAALAVVALRLLEYANDWFRGRT